MLLLFRQLLIMHLRCWWLKVLSCWQLLRFQRRLPGPCPLIGAFARCSCLLPRMRVHGHCLLTNGAKQLGFLRIH
jgi:hypothetical protein